MASSTKFKMESGIQLLARLRKKQEFLNFYPTIFELGIKNEDLIEITSNTTASCLLIDIICEALIASELGGPELKVILFITDGLIQYEEILHVMQQKTVACINKKKLTNDYLEKSLQKSLNNLYLLEIFDITEFYCTLYNLENIFSEYSNMSLIVVENLVSFYWSEQDFKITKMDLYQKSFIKLIRSINKEYKIPILYGKPQYFNSGKTENVDTKDNIVTCKIDISSNLNNSSIFKVNISTEFKEVIKYYKIINDLLTWTTAES